MNFKQFFTSFYLFSKKYAKSIPLLIVLVIFVGSLFLLNGSQKSEKTVTAGIYANKDSYVTDSLVDKMNSDFSSVKFVKYDSTKKMKDDIRSSKIQCGFAFTDNMLEKLHEANLKDTIDIYTTKNNILVYLVKEYLFSEVYSEYAINELTNMLAKDEAFEIKTTKDKEELRELVKTKFYEYMNSSETFTVVFENEDKSTVDAGFILSSYLLISIRGMVSLIIMILAFIGTFYLFRDTKSGVFYHTYGINRCICKFNEIFSMTLYASVFCIIGLVITGNATNIFKEIFAIVLYSLGVSLYCYILYELIRNQTLFVALTPFFIICCIIFCPIFFNMAEIMPIANKIAWAFPPNYYIMFF
jgi:ABC-2 type transport system permease protein